MQHRRCLALLALLAVPALAEKGYGMNDKPEPPPTAPPYEGTMPPVDPPEPPPMTEPPPPEATEAPAPEPTEAPAPDPTEAPEVEATEPPPPEPTEAPAPEATTGYEGEEPPPPPPEPDMTEAPATDAPEPEGTEAPAEATEAPEPEATDAPAEATEAPETGEIAVEPPPPTEPTMEEGYGAEGGVKAPPPDDEPATGGMTISDGYGIRRFGAKRWAALKQVDWNQVREEDTELRLLAKSRCQDRHKWCSFWAKFKAGDQNPKTGQVFELPLCLENAFLSTLDGCPQSCNVCVTDAKVWRRRVKLAKMKRTLRRLSLLKL